MASIGDDHFVSMEGSIVSPFIKSSSVPVKQMIFESENSVEMQFQGDELDNC